MSCRTKVTLDTINIKVYTKAITMKKFKPPLAIEKKWADILKVSLNFRKIWSIKPFAVTPRDMLTWLKLQHRTLYVAKHDPKTNGECQACTELENAIHLCECKVIT